MLKKKFYLFFLLVAIIVLSIDITTYMLAKVINNQTVLHGNSEYSEYPNSVAHMQNNLENTKYFELDLQITKDNRIICYHGDENLNDINFNSNFIKNLIFLKKNCYDKELVDFLKLNPNIYIITDFKKNNIKGLKEVKKKFNNLSNQIIPQIYFFDEYDAVRELGYKKIIFSTYKIPDAKNEEILNIINKMELFAITVDPARLRKNFYNDKINVNNNFFIYVHTVNSWIRLLQYKVLYGANGIYTDKIFIKKNFILSKLFL